MHFCDGRDFFLRSMACEWRTVGSTNAELTTVCNRNASVGGRKQECMTEEYMCASFSHVRRVLNSGEIFDVAS